MAHESEEKEQEAIGGFFTLVRHRKEPDDGERRERKERPPGPPGDINTGAQVVHEDTADAHGGDATDGMTTAEATGELPYGRGEPTGRSASEGGGTSG